MKNNISFAVLTIFALSVISPCVISCHRTAADMSSLPGDVLSSEEGVPPDLLADRDSPVELRVGQAFLKNDQLHLKVLLDAKTNVSSEAVVISVLGLRDGTVVEEQNRLLRDEVAEDTLDAGRNVAMFFTLQESALTEYQVKCRWGEDAQEIIAREMPGEMPRKMMAEGDSSYAATQDEIDNTELASARLQTEGPIIEDLQTVEQVVSCPTPPCDVFYTLFGTLHNASSEPVQGLKLAIGLFWVNDGQSLPSTDGARLLANEKLIPLGALKMAPGARKKVRVAVDRGVPNVPGGRFLPRLRVLSYSQDAE